MADPYFNALQVKYAYAVTCHKSQGGQWACVFVDQGFLTEEMLDTSYFRWLYTALTRATEKLFLVNFNGFFFSSRRRHTRSVSAFLLNRSSDLQYAHCSSLHAGRFFTFWLVVAC